MSYMRNTLVGLGDGIGVGVFMPGYAFKKISGKEIKSVGEDIDTGKTTVCDANRESLEYRISKGFGKFFGVVIGAPAYPIGIAFDLVNNDYPPQKVKNREPYNVLTEAEKIAENHTKTLYTIL